MPAGRSCGKGGTTSADDLFTEVEAGAAATGVGPPDNLGATFEVAEAPCDAGAAGAVDPACTEAGISVDDNSATVADFGTAAGVRGHSRMPDPTTAAARATAVADFQPGPADLTFGLFEWRPPITTPPTFA